MKQPARRKTIVKNPSTLVSPGLLTSRKNRPVISSAENVSSSWEPSGMVEPAASFVVHAARFESIDTFEKILG
jgi:hypothetical protein